MSRSKRAAHQKDLAEPKKNHKEIEREDEESSKDLSVWMPGMELEEGEELEADPAAYLMLHSLTTEWPCLSFDFVADSYGDERYLFPFKCNILAGTCADRPDQNKVLHIECSNLARTGGYDSDSEPSEDEEIPEPSFKCTNLEHLGGVNRIRSHSATLFATFSDQAKVNIFSSTQLAYTSTKKEHRTEGFGLAWSPREPLLLSGDNNGALNLYQPKADCFVCGSMFFGNASSIEDINWSPSESNVFACCSTDGAVRIYDIRSTNPVVSHKLSSTDVNVISWNKNAPHLLASGAEDGVFAVHDMRNWNEPLFSFSWHKAAVTSIEWHPTDSSVLAVAGDDEQISLWDFSAEADESKEENNQVADFPPQLLFIHAGQKEIKELHWHPQAPGFLASTSASGFNIFKTISI